MTTENRLILTVIWVGTAC